jgi:hypothetical protein
LPIEDTPTLGGKQETARFVAEAGVVRTGLVGEKLDEPTQQQTQLGTGGVASEESLEREPKRQWSPTSTTWRGKLGFGSA